MKASEQYLRVVLFTMLYMALTFCGKNNQVCDPSNASYCTVLHNCGAEYYAAQGELTFFWFLTNEMTAAEPYFYLVLFVFSNFMECKGSV